MKITIEAHGITHSTELGDDIESLNGIIRGMLLAVGYHISTVDEFFPSVDQLAEMDYIETKRSFGI